ncbi:MAG: sodium:solute symporter family protein [Treponema sp.]|jgi:SSS family solute:Na+ symporter|nr:sodium:solute symporter family protein [Treponema sp.]
MATNIAVMVLYFGVTIGIGLYFGGKKTESSSDYTVSGRKLGGFVYLLTMIATMVGASSVMGGVSYWSRRGLSQIWYWFGGHLQTLIFLLYLGPRINAFGREHGGETIGDWFIYRYGKVSKFLASVLIALAYVAITAFQYLAMAVILNLVFNIPFNVALLITSVVVVFYTSVGGLWAVVTTDIFQGILTWLGVIVMGILFYSRAGGIQPIIKALPPEHLRWFGNVTPWNAFASMLTLGLGIISWPDVWQRIYAVKNIRTYRQSTVVNLIIGIFLTAAVCGLGFASRVLMPDYSGSPNNMLPLMILNYFPNVVGAIFFAVLLAVIMGSADSVLLVSGIIISKDIIEPFFKRPRTDKEILRFRKIVTAVTGFFTLIVLFFSTDMFTLWVMSADITGATLAVPILFGFAWKRPDERAVLASIIFGFAGWLVFTVFKFPVPINAILPGALLSLIAYVVTAFAAPPRKGKAPAHA